LARLARAGSGLGRLGSMPTLFPLHLNYKCRLSCMRPEILAMFQTIDDESDEE